MPGDFETTKAQKQISLDVSPLPETKHLGLKLFSLITGGGTFGLLMWIEFATLQNYSAISRPGFETLLIIAWITSIFAIGMRLLRPYPWYAKVLLAATATIFAGLFGLSLMFMWGLMYGGDTL